MKQVGKKLLTLIITLLVVSLLAFLAFQIIPGDPTTKMLGTNATPEKAALLRRELGLDRPVFVRYFEWLFQFVRGKFGTSYTYKMPVSDMLSDKLPVTVLLTLLSFLITVLVALPLGIAAGRIKNRWADHAVLIADQLLMAIPPFFFGILACFLFGIVFRLFTPGNFIPPSEDLTASIGCLLLPALSLALPRIEIGRAHV